MPCACQALAKCAASMRCLRASHAPAHAVLLLSTQNTHCAQVGASSKLACVIDGESLMNDGSALVIFLLLQKIVEGEPVTIGGVRASASARTPTRLSVRHACLRARLLLSVARAFASGCACVQARHMLSAWLPVDLDLRRLCPSSACWRWWACSWGSRLALRPPGFWVSPTPLCALLHGQ